MNICIVSSVRSIKLRKHTNSTKCIAFCGVLSALAVVVMLITFIPYLLFIAPVLACCIVAIINIELDYKYALSSYAVISTLSILFSPDKEAAMIFVGVFGLYPLIKGFFENKFRSNILKFILKLLYLNITLVISYLVIVFIFGIPLEGMNDLGKFTIPILIILANFMFIMNDVALSAVFTLYSKKFKGKFFKL